MDNMRLYYRGLNAQVAIKEFNGYLPTIVNTHVANELCSLQTGKQITNNELVKKLKNHNILVEESGKLYSKIPMLTQPLSTDIEKVLKAELKSIDYAGEKIIAKIADKLSDNWDTIAHSLLGQLIIGTLWFNMNIKLSKSVDNTVALLLPDMDLNHIFYNGIYPLYGNSTVVYWQSTLLCHPDTVYDILNDKNVVVSLRGLNDRLEFIPSGNALVLLKKLKMYKNRSDDNKLPVSYVSLPEVTKQTVVKIGSELKQLAKVFHSVYPKLNKVANEFYSSRNESQKQVSEHSFNQMVYLVFSYCVVEKWLASNNLPNTVLGKDKKKKQSSPKWSL
jgi:hypothetical protein